MEVLGVGILFVNRDASVSVARNLLLNEVSAALGSYQGSYWPQRSTRDLFVQGPANIP